MRLTHRTHLPPRPSGSALDADIPWYTQFIPHEPGTGRLRARPAGVEAVLAGGTMSTAADRAIAARLTAAAPDFAAWLAAHRLVQQRALRYAVDVLGLRQVLELGCGHWTSPGSAYSWIWRWETNHPGQRLRYVGLDADPIVTGAIHQGTGTWPAHTVVRGDLANLGTLCDGIRLAGQLDLTAPVLVLATGVLQHLDRPGPVLSEARAQACAGSVLAVSHPALPARASTELYDAIEEYRRDVAPWWPRLASAAGEILSAWSVPPGDIMPVGRWHPPTPTPGDNDPVPVPVADAPGWAALAVIPHTSFPERGRA
ncbi:SAM-dependent methyltransferase [Catenuloplanes japonicus]|uniref:SAM-dependent methyltransferase n=1 Tax=Catenuloplanes japonicus TaxID=33876 RepID=UPI000B20541C|nr:SAM-dependent methyltransferase [Catenuloplanes japonicus]